MLLTNLAPRVKALFFQKKILIFIFERGSEKSQSGFKIKS